MSTNVGIVLGLVIIIAAPSARAEGRLTVGKVVGTGLAVYGGYKLGQAIADAIVPAAKNGQRAAAPVPTAAEVAAAEAKVRVAAEKKAAQDAAHLAASIESGRMMTAANREIERSGPAKLRATIAKWSALSAPDRKRALRAFERADATGATELIGEDAHQNAAAIFKRFKEHIPAQLAAHLPSEYETRRTGFDKGLSNAQQGATTYTGQSSKSKRSDNIALVQRGENVEITSSGQGDFGTLSHVKLTYNGRTDTGRMTLITTSATDRPQLIDVKLGKRAGIVRTLAQENDKLVDEVAVVRNGVKGRVTSKSKRVTQQTTPDLAGLFNPKVESHTREHVVTTGEHEWKSVTTEGARGALHGRQQTAKPLLQRIKGRLFGHK